jgi:hypothetical protein
MIQVPGSCPQAKRLTTDHVVADHLPQLAHNGNIQSSGIESAADRLLADH